MQLLSSAEIVTKLASVPEWKLAGDTIERTIAFADFVAAMAYVNRIAEAAETAGHHPDIDIRWNKVRLALSSHDAGGLTASDFALASKANSLI